MSDSINPIVHVDGLVKRYGDRTVLNGVNLALSRGEFVALTGPSGAGKSTLLHLLGALESPDAGSIEIDGIRLGKHNRANLSRFRRFHVGIVFQLHNLIPRLTAAQNIELAMFSTHRSRRDRHEHALALLKRFELGALANRHPPQLSGGERARVALARGLANDPPVLLADEPTGNLDDHSAALVVDILHDLAANDSVAVLCVSHDARLNVRASRTLLLDDGSVS